VSSSGFTQGCLYTCSVNSGYRKSSKLTKLTIDYLKVEKLERNFDLGPPNDATININNALIM
jgi:hypothetical protein